MNSNIVSVNFGGDTLSVRASTVADLRSEANSALVGYDPTKVEFVLDGQVLPDSTTLANGATIVVRTKANGKG